MNADHRILCAEWFARPCGRLVVALLVLVVPATTPCRGQTRTADRDMGFVPFSEEPIRYLSDQVNDPVARLQDRLDRDQLRLEYEPEHGYLKSVLKALEVPVSSQGLVFSKSSFQYRRISPQTPRALYFNDSVYVGWVKDGHSLELSAFDPNQGAVFYLLEQQESDQPVFIRATLDCTQCHVAPGTRGVPGVLVRSITTQPSGTQATSTRSFISGHESPFRERFGGWFVTGTHGRMSHMGNVFAENRQFPEKLDSRAGANVKSLADRFSTTPYLTPHSDLVAQLVLAHQTQMHNLITLTNFQTRLALHAELRTPRTGQRQAGMLSEAARRQIEKPAEELVRYLLFADEALLDEPVDGTSGFAREFEAKGPRDDRGRSLREFDLKRRIFKYPCSYLIYSESFDAIPAPACQYIYGRLLEVLSGKDQSSAFAHLSGATRREILEILRATKPGLPDGWNSKRPASPPASCTRGPKSDDPPSRPVADHASIAF